MAHPSTPQIKVVLKVRAVKSTVVSAFVGSLLFCSLGCGVFFISGAIQTGSTIHGSVTSVTVSSVMNGTGGTTQVTFVTFLQNAVPTTVDFCGNQAPQFPLSRTVNVNFNPGQFCAVIVTVVVL